MTVKERFERYIYIDGKIADLEDDIRRLYGSWTSYESVQASYTESPWISHTVPVQGYDGVLYNRDRIEELQSQKNRWIEEKQKIEQIVDNIVDLKAQRVVRLRYIKGESWRGVAANMGYTISEDNARMIAKKFLESISDFSLISETA